MSVRIDRAPVAGRLLLGEREIGPDDMISPADFANLSYRRSQGTKDDAFTFRVSDAWGNSEVGVVVITAAANRPNPVAPEEPALPPVNLSAAAVSTIGFGPNLKFKEPLPAIANDLRTVKLLADPPIGQFVLGERVIERGRMVRVRADLSQLAFSAPAGAEGKAFEAVFVPSDGASGTAKISIDLVLGDCDRLAGDRLDAQGVGPGVLAGRIDLARALPACEQATGPPNSGRLNYQLARVYSALGRNKEAIATYKKAADLGYTRAVWALGYRALYVPPIDPAAGLALLERAAGAGDVYAIHTLGQAYYEGRGVPKDLEKARKLFETGARMGHTFSMNSLGRMYLRGEAVEANPALARRYWEESAARGDIYGLDNLGYLYLDGVDVPKDPARALAYFQQAADLGHPEAPNNIGRLYFLGIGVPSNLVEARRWYAIGVERGDAWAALNLAELMRQGKGAPPDPLRAGYLYARAAASSNRPEPAEIARRELVSYTKEQKEAVLRLLVQDIESQAYSKSDAEIAGSRDASLRSKT